MSTNKVTGKANEPIGSGKPQGTIFGGMDIRMVRRLRQRQLQKKQAKSKTSFVSNKTKRGFI